MFRDKPPQRVSTDFRLTKSRLNILLLGESGAGKSTFINCLPNYLTYPDILSLNDHVDDAHVAIPSMVTIYDDNYQEIETKYCHGISAKDVENECFIQGQSATQNVKAHKFLINKCELTIIDTPGLGDSRGVEQDKKNFQMTMDFLENYKELDAIFILVHPNYLHLNAGLKTVLHLVVERFGKVAMDNIFFCFTRTRDVSYGFGDTLTGLRIFFKERNYGIELKKNNCFSFDNEGFSCLLKHKIGYKNDPFCEKSWNHSVDEVKRLLKECSFVLAFNVEDPRVTHEILPELLRIHEKIEKNNKTHYADQKDLPIEQFNIILEHVEKSCNLPFVLQNFKKQTASNDKINDLKRALQFMEKSIKNAEELDVLQKKLANANDEYDKLQMETDEQGRKFAGEVNRLSKEAAGKDKVIQEQESKLSSKQEEIRRLQQKLAEDIRCMKEASDKEKNILLSQIAEKSNELKGKDKTIGVLQNDASSKQKEIVELKKRHEKDIKKLNEDLEKKKKNLLNQYSSSKSTSNNGRESPTQRNGSPHAIGWVSSTTGQQETFISYIDQSSGNSHTTARNYGSPTNNFTPPSADTGLPGNVGIHRRPQQQIGITQQPTENQILLIYGIPSNIYLSISSKLASKSDPTTIENIKNIVGYLKQEKELNYAIRNNMSSMFYTGNLGEKMKNGTSAVSSHLQGVYHLFVAKYMDSHSSIQSVNMHCLVVDGKIVYLDTYFAFSIRGTYLTKDEPIPNGKYTDCNIYINVKHQKKISTTAIL